MYFSYRERITCADVYRWESLVQVTVRLRSPRSLQNSLQAGGTHPLTAAGDCVPGEQRDIFSALKKLLKEFL